jgi:hypothetical protein
LPTARLRFTRAVGYRQLLEAIQVHGYTMMLGARRQLEPAEVARDWYANVYRPTIELLATAPIALCAGATESDAFLTLWDHRRELSVEHAGLQLPDALRIPIEVGKGRRRRQRLQRPR